MMKKTLLTLCCLLYSFLFFKGLSQQRPELYLGGGFIHGTKDAHISSSKGGSLGFFRPLLSKPNLSLGVDLSAGYHLTKKENSTNPQPFELPGVESSYVLEDPNLSPSSQILRFGLGPRADFNLGEKLQLTTAIEGGLAVLKSEPIAFDQIIKVGDQEYKKRIYSREKIANNSFQLTPKLRLSYPLSEKVKVFAEGSYMLSRLKTIEEHVQTVDGEGNPYKDWGQFVESKYATQNNNTSWNPLGAQVGITLGLGKSKSKSTEKLKTKNNSRAKSNSKPEQVKPQEKRVLLPVTPKNNSRFTSGEELKSLGWKLLGVRIPNTSYSVTLVQLDAKRRPQRTYHAQVSSMEISISQLTKGRALEEGNYRWQVSEVGTGLMTSMQFFSVGSCSIQFEIQEESINCLGYVGENRKYQICFNSVYQSSSGDLTYNHSSSGLTIYDQNNSVIPHTLVGSQPVLVSQAGANSSSVQYCFEVEVAPHVSSIGIGLQGDDLDPGPILCQPGVSVVIDSLPDCLCKDCDEMTLNFDQVEVNQLQSNTNVFSFTGDLQVNVPIYSIEFQVLSFSYNANPEPCSGGITTIEEAGMFLRNGSTVNNSSNLSFYTSSGDPNNNPDASKIVTYTANNPISGSIPIQLHMGLPGPLAGFDADCCKMSYEVCFRIVVYYDPSNCKSCVFTKCFQFTN